MSIFKKKIVTPKVYRANTPFSGGKAVTAMTVDRIKKIHDTAKQMIADGIKITAPFAHKDENGIVPKPLLEGQLGSWNSAINGGYWKDFEIDPEDGGLIGFLDAPGDLDDLNTPAGKVGKTIQETSVFLMPEWEDGLGKTREDALWHIALVDGKAVESNQKNFEKVEDPKLALAMSFSMSDAIDNDPTPEQGENKSSLVMSIKEQLEEKLEITLLEDTNETNFLDRLLTVLTAMKSKKEDEDLTQKPEGAEQVSSPIAMSEPTPEVIEKKTNSLLSSLNTHKKLDLKSRLGALQSKGIVGKKRAEDWANKIDAIAMSLNDFDDDGNCPQTAIEMAIENFEEGGISLLDPPNEDKPKNVHGVEEPSDMGVEEALLSKEDANEVYSTMGL